MGYMFQLRSSGIAINITMSGSTSRGPEDDSIEVETCSPYCYNIF